MQRNAWNGVAESKDSASSEQSSPVRNVQMRMVPQARCHENARDNFEGRTRERGENDRHSVSPLAAMAAVDTHRYYAEYFGHEPELLHTLHDQLRRGSRGDRPESR